MKRFSIDNTTLKKFGVTMGLALCIISLIMLLKNSSKIIFTSILALIFFILSLSVPFILKPLYIIWMGLAGILSWINTRILLVIIFYLIFTPISLVMKLFRKDMLDRKIQKYKDSYWINKDYKAFVPLDYERQF